MKQSQKKTAAIARDVSLEKTDAFDEMQHKLVSAHR